MTTTTTQPTRGRENEQGQGGPCQVHALTSARGKSTLSLDQPSSSVNSAVEARFAVPGVQIVPVTGSVALERASVHDVIVDGRRIGGVCYARGAWRVLSHTQAEFASLDDAVEALMQRRGRSQ